MAHQHSVLRRKVLGQSGLWRISGKSSRFVFFEDILLRAVSLPTESVKLPLSFGEKSLMIPASASVVANVSGNWHVLIQPELVVDGVKQIQQPVYLNFGVRSNADFWTSVCLAVFPIAVGNGGFAYWLIDWYRKRSSGHGSKPDPEPRGPPESPEEKQTKVPETHEP